MTALPPAQTTGQTATTQTTAALTVAASLAMLVLTGPAAPAGWAQYSPNCERNGRRDYCAYTPDQRASSPSQDVGLLVYADHRIYRVTRLETTCRQSGAVRTCQARIQVPPASGTPIPATYRGTSFEGGYRHAFTGGGLQLSFGYLD